MKAKLLAALASICLQLGGVCSPLARSSQPASGEHVFFLGDERLVVLNLQVFLHGQPQRQVWRDFQDLRFKKLDANGDGVLAGDEMRGLPSIELLSQFGLITRPEQASNLLMNTSPRDGQLTKSEFERGYQRMGLEPFRLRFDLGTAPMIRADAVDGVRRPPNEGAPRVLFEMLDADRDGRISAAELRRGAHLLRKLDLDRDESISTMELAQMANFHAVATADSGNSLRPAAAKFLMVTPTQPALQVARHVMQALDGRNRGSVKDNRLSFAEVGWPAARLAPFDADGDGELDFDETQRLVTAPPDDVELIVRFGITRNRQPIEILGAAEDGAAPNRTLTFGKVQMELSAPGSSSSELDERQLAQRFKLMDQDGNGYLDKMEAARRGLNAQTFAVLDDDKDDKIFEREYLAVYLPLGQMEQVRVQLDIADRGRDLLRVMDINRDGSLAPREFTAAAERLSNWDSDGDGKLAMHELPHQYQLTVSRGTLNPAGRAVLVATAGRAAAPAFTPRTTGPQWFTKMDRNADGDVSRREFLGPADVFARLDKDGNGLIDASEASAED